MARPLTVGQLRKQMEDMADNTLVVRQGHDHDFRPTAAHETTALYDRESDTLTQDHGEDSTPEAEYGKRIAVLLID